MMAVLVAQGQGDQPERDLLGEYAEALESEEGSKVTNLLLEHMGDERFAQATGMLHQMFDPNKSFVDQLEQLRARRG